MRSDAPHVALTTVRVLLATFTAIALAGTAHAQQSPNYKINEQVFNAGGHPASGSTMHSSSFWVSLDSIGEDLLRSGLSSPSYRIDAGFGEAYPPAGEVHDLLWSSKTAFGWDAEKSAALYNVYRGTLSSLPGTYGMCFQSSIQGRSVSDAAIPQAGSGSFYLVTAKNRLNEEGTKGYRSDGVQRSNAAPCP